MRLLSLWCTIAVFFMACSRDDPRQGIALRVVNEIRVADPFGEVQTTQTGAQGAVVYLVPSDTPRYQLGVTQPAWERCEVDADDRCVFPDREGLYHGLADLNDDGQIDGWAYDVRSGTSRTIVVSSLSSLGEAWLQVALSDQTVRIGESPVFTLTGHLPTEEDVALEVWREGSERTRLLTIGAGRFSGDVTHTGSFPVAATWTPTPPDQVGDYLIIPVARERYFRGSRFSVRSALDPLRAIGIRINNGAPKTLSRNVTLTFEAQNASYMTFGESVSALTTVIRYPFLPSLGYALSAGDGRKTVWAMFYDAEENFAGPVSASIELDELPPAAPDEGRFVVLMNPPGHDDYLTGLPGAVESHSLVTVYGNAALTLVLTQGRAEADGSFGPLNIGDNRVVKPLDYVYVTATDELDREGPASPAYNDATPPDLRREDIQAIWSVDRPAWGIGNTGDTIRAQYERPAFFEPASDVTGGYADLSSFGGPSAVTMTVYADGVWGAEYKLPDDLSVSGFRYVRVKIFDAAGNESFWMTSLWPAQVDTVPPRPPTVSRVKGDNRMLGARWNIGASDIAYYEARITNPAGFEANYFIGILDYYTLFAGEKTGAPEPDLYAFEFLPNCHWYTFQVRAVDVAGNEGEYSVPVTARVILPPPDFEAWAGLSGTTGTIAFTVAPVVNASAYELHFATAPGAPYEYAGSVTSPLRFTADEMQLRYLRGLPLRTTFYVSSRSRDDDFGECASDFSAEMTATTDLTVSSYFDGATSETIGGSLAKVSDIDGDGVDDMLAGAPYPRYAALVSGADARVFDQVGYYWAPDSYDIPGNSLAAADLDGDGVDEYLVGSPLESPGGLFLAGAVRVYDKNKTLRATLFGDRPGQQFGFSIVRVGDLDLPPDGNEEFAVGGFGCARKQCGPDDTAAPAEEGPGRVVVYDGATLTPKYELRGLAKGDYYGVSLAVVSDLDGDTVPDLVIGAPGTFRASPNARLHYVSGHTGATLRSHEFEGSTEFRPGAALATLSGVPGEGELLIVGTTGRGDNAGAVMALRMDGTPVWARSGALLFAGPNFGGTLATGGDVNGDGVPDIVVGAPLGAQAMFYGSGVAFVLDGKTGRTLYEMRGTSVDGSVGYSVLLPGDLVRGPRAEWVVGAPGSGFGGYQSGRLYLLTTDP